MQIFFWPLLIGIGSAVGLVSALLGDGIHDIVSWLLLSIPIVVAAYYSRAR